MTEHTKFTECNIDEIQTFPSASKSASPLLIKNLRIVSDDCSFAIFDKSNIDLFIARNQNQQGYSDIPLATTNFISPLNAEETDILFTNFLAEKKVVCDVVVLGMFWKVYHSDGFASTSIYVKLYFHAGKNPTMEFRRVEGNCEIFFNIYSSFRNLILNENNPINMTPPCEIKTRNILTSEEENVAMQSLIQWLHQSPSDAIKVVSHVAMEKDIDYQTIMCEEVFNVLSNQINLSCLMVQTLGFIDVIKSIDCLLDDTRKTLILTNLKQKLRQSLDLPNIPESVKQRAMCLINS